MEKKKDRRIDRQTDRPTLRQTDWQTERQTNRKKWARWGTNSMAQRQARNLFGFRVARRYLQTPGAITTTTATRTAAAAAAAATEEAELLVGCKAR